MIVWSERTFLVLSVTVKGSEMLVHRVSHNVGLGTVEIFSEGVAMKTLQVFLALLEDLLNVQLAAVTGGFSHSTPTSQAQSCGAFERRQMQFAGPVHLCLCPGARVQDAAAMHGCEANCLFVQVQKREVAHERGSPPRFICAGWAPSTNLEA